MSLLQMISQTSTQFLNQSTLTKKTSPKILSLMQIQDQKQPSSLPIQDSSTSWARKVSKSIYSTLMFLTISTRTEQVDQPSRLCSKIWKPI